MIIGERGCDVIGAANAAGVPISPEKLSATHRQDLICRPHVRQLEHGAGTESVYPVGTAKQIIAYGRLKQKFGSDYRRIGWELWLMGFQVDEQYWREPYRQTSSSFEYAGQSFLKNRRDEAPIPSDKTMDTIEEISKRRSPTRFFGTLRRSLRSESQTVMIMALEVAAGRFGTVPSDDKHRDFIIGRVLKLRPARKKRKIVPASSPFNVSARELVDMLKEISREFSKLAKSTARVFSEQELKQASQECTMLINAFVEIGKLDAQNSGQSSSALSTLAAIARDLTVSRHAFFIRCWMVARNIPAVREGAGRYLDEMHRVAAVHSAKASTI